MANEKVSVNGEEKHAAQWAPAGREAYYSSDSAQNRAFIEILFAYQNSLKHSEVGWLKCNEFDCVNKILFTKNHEKVSNWCNEKVGHGEIEDEDLCDGLEFYIQQDRQNN